MNMCTTRLGMGMNPRGRRMKGSKQKKVTRKGGKRRRGKKIRN